MADVREVTAGGVAGARDLEQLLRRWVRQDDLDKGHRSGGPTIAERQELHHLRTEVKTLRMPHLGPGGIGRGHDVAVAVGVVQRSPLGPVGPWRRARRGEGERPLLEGHERAVVDHGRTVAGRPWP